MDDRLDVIFIAAGYYKEGDYLFSKPADLVLPEDFDNEDLLEKIGT
jgi:hypothetical protein